MIPMAHHRERSWRILDTFDWYSPWYQSKHTYEEVFRWFESCGLEDLRVIDQPIAVRNEFRSIVDGSRYHLDAGDDGDPDLYAAVGSTRPLSDLIRHMIVRSSNLATNLLIDQLGASRVTVFGALSSRSPW